jgi:hypothetical protein
MAQHISESIGLNYLMAEAVRDGCQIILKAGRINFGSPIRCLSHTFLDSPESEDSNSPQKELSETRTRPRASTIYGYSMPLEIPRQTNIPRSESWSNNSTKTEEIEWNGEICVLPCLYEAAFRRLVLFLICNHKSIIKLQMLNDSFYPINKNIIIHVPYCSDIRNIKRCINEFR